MPKQNGEDRTTEQAATKSETAEIRDGWPLPWSAQAHHDGVNFSLFSRHATGVRLEFYDRPEDALPSRSIALDPVRNRTGDVWHVWVRGVPSGQLYAYRVEGPYQPCQGLRFNPQKLLLDPLASAIEGNAHWDFGPARGYDDSPLAPPDTPSRENDAGAMPKCVYVHHHFDWEADRGPLHSAADTIIYETHVRGATIHPSSRVAHPGTYLGLTELIPYFRELGVTTIELMPVAEFNENELTQVNPVTGERLKNYWGYNPVAFVAPKQSYASAKGRGACLDEFQQMVKAFHQAGIEVLLDVVLNHTAEGNEIGPTLSLRGIDNLIYYLLDESDCRRYRDFTGTGNTLNANHPVVREFIRNVLRYWVIETHVDGFRFDLASVLGRGRDGRLLPNPPLLESLAEDAILRDVKLVAEAWDAGGAYQVGSFSERRWMEWNGRFRDDVRRFWLGEPAGVGALASRICGSSDLYQPSGKTPACSVNFVTCHDGFTLNDLVSYREKHNDANGEQNRDGMDWNDSDNCGVEGPADDPAVESLRKRLIKNFLLTLFVSRGVPMLLGGDEFRRTQFGNNNAYCQDNETSWYDWSCRERHREIHRFTRLAIALRRAHPVLQREVFYGPRDVRWFNPEGSAPDWGDEEQRALGCLIFGRGGPDLCLLFNASGEPASFAMPAPVSGAWHRAADTSLAPPGDIHETGSEPPAPNPAFYRLGPRASAVLVARRSAT